MDAVQTQNRVTQNASQNLYIFSSHKLDIFHTSWLVACCCYTKVFSESLRMVNITSMIRTKYSNGRRKCYIAIALVLLLYILHTNENPDVYDNFDTVTYLGISSKTKTTGTMTPPMAVNSVKQRVIDRSESSFPKEQVQMCWEQVQYILSHLPEDGNLLIWGLGYDSIYWNTVTTGRVVFLEDGDMNTNLVPNPDPNESSSSSNTKNMVRWYDSMTYQYPQLQAYTVNYTTQNSISQLQDYKKKKKLWKKELNIPNLPHAIFHTRWDVIIVDAPLGYPNTGPGRFQSIYMTKIIAEHTFSLLSFQQQQQLQQGGFDASSTVKSNTNNVSDLAQEHVVHVFVDDYERRVEKEFSLAVFHPVKPERVVSRPAYKQHVTPNDQAHFILSSSTMI